MIFIGFPLDPHVTSGRIIRSWQRRPLPACPDKPAGVGRRYLMRFNPLKIGELARRTGLTVRTLHHYDAIGLLHPSLHTEAGHRLYTADDIARLQQVLSLRQLGFSLDQVRECLDQPDFLPLE